MLLFGAELHFGNFSYFFVLLAGIAILSAVLLYALDGPAKRVLARTAQGNRGDLTDVPEGIARPQNA